MDNFRISIAIIFLLLIALPVLFSILLKALPDSFRFGNPVNKLDTYHVFTCLLLVAIVIGLSHNWLSMPWLIVLTSILIIANCVHYETATRQSILFITKLKASSPAQRVNQMAELIREFLADDNQAMITICCLDRNRFFWNETGLEDKVRTHEILAQIDAADQGWRKSVAQDFIERVAAYSAAPRDHNDPSRQVLIAAPANPLLRRFCLYAFWVSLRLAFPIYIGCSKLPARHKVAQ